MGNEYIVFTIYGWHCSSPVPHPNSLRPESYRPTAVVGTFSQKKQNLILSSYPEWTILCLKEYDQVLAVDLHSKSDNSNDCNSLRIHIRQTILKRIPSTLTTRLFVFENGRIVIVDLVQKTRTV